MQLYKPIGNSMEEYNKVILFVSHKKAQCGIYEFGKNITDILQYSKLYRFVRVECSSLCELQVAIAENKPSAIIYNYSPPIFPWLNSEAYRDNISSMKIPQIAITHDMTQAVADSATTYRKGFLHGLSSLLNSLFDYYIAPDPTIVLTNPYVYKIGRLIPSYENNFPTPIKLTVGSCGLGTPNKRFEWIVQVVQREFDKAIIRFHIPIAEVGDPRGGITRAIIQRCRAQIAKPGIKLVITHEYLDGQGVLDFLAQNTLNIFMYDAGSDRGLSSAIDMAMAVKRPLAVSMGEAFHHVLDVEPSICTERNNLKSIIRNGFAPLQKHYNEWSAANILLEHEKILDSVLAKQLPKGLIPV